MPPKPKYTREQIVAAALEVTAKGGPQALTAKGLGAALGTSTSPIFTVFDSMQQVQDEVKTAAMARFEAYAHSGESGMPAFKQVGMQMIRFAMEEPKLYQLIFMSENEDVRSFEDIYGHLGSVADECLRGLCAEHELTEGEARELFEHVWIHTFGIASLCATGACRFSREQIAQLLTQDFSAMMLLLRGRRDA